MSRPASLFSSKDEELLIDVEQVTHVVWVDPYPQQQQKMLWVYFASGLFHKLTVIDGMAFTKLWKKFHFDQWKNLEDDPHSPNYDQDLPAFVSRRLKEMEAHPGMWATTKESYLSQVALLVELLIGRQAALDFEKAIEPHPGETGERFEDVWAKYVIAGAKGTLIQAGALT